MSAEQDGLPTEPETIPGDRAAHSVARVLSLQSRLSNLLAFGLMSVLGLGALTWYYASAIQRQGRTKQTAQAAASNRAQGDVPLPSLGRIDPPGPPPFDPLGGPADARSSITARTLTEVPLAPTTSMTAHPSNAGSVKTPAQLAIERQLSGAVFARQGGADLGVSGGLTSGLAPGLLPSTLVPGQTNVPAGATQGAGAEPAMHDELGAMLRPTVTPAARAQMLPAKRLLLPKGAFVDCTLETAIDSTLPGMTTCVMATDTFGADGNVVLMERGTKLIGETRGQVQQGSARVFVLWTEARTPSGVVVPLESPGTDQLGRSGLTGDVNRHFWQRFGAAILVSIIDGVVQSAAESSHGGSGNVLVNPSSSQDVVTELLKGTIGIAPTITVRNGERVQVLVARDLDFRSVYELRSIAAVR